LQRASSGFSPKRYHCGSRAVLYDLKVGGEAELTIAAADKALLHFDRSFGGVECLHADFRTHAYGTHSHDEFVIAIVDRGAEEFRCRGGAHVAPEGAIYTINPGEPHDGRGAGEDGWSYRALYPSMAFMQRIGGVAPIFTRVVLFDSILFRLLSAVHAAILGEECELAKETAIVAAFERLGALNAEVDDSSAPLKDDSRMNRVREILSDRFADRHSLESLSETAGLHPNYLLAAFKQRYGVTPAAFLRMRRLAKAKAMIRSRVPLKNVAQDAGFYDQAHFTRCFKNAFGVTPSVYSAACA
jgi:AraC-like DNA-binding protein